MSDYLSRHALFVALSASLFILGCVAQRTGDRRGSTYRYDHPPDSLAIVNRSPGDSLRSRARPADRERDDHQRPPPPRWRPVPSRPCTSDDPTLIGFIWDVFFHHDDDEPVVSGRGSLSGAMEKASDDHHGDRTVPEGQTYYPPRDEPRPPPPKPAPSSDRSRESSDLTNLYGCLGLHFNSGTIRGTDYYGAYGAGLSLGMAKFMVKRPLRFSLQVQALDAPVQTTSRLRKSLSGGVGIFEFGGSVDIFTTPYYTFMGHYLTAGVMVSELAWNYRHTLTTETGTNISDDGLMGFDFYLGTGWNPIQVESFELGFEARFGAILWSGQTDKGFHNDFFGTFEYFTLVTTIRYKWW